MLPELVDPSPPVWFVEVNGFPADIRSAPVGLRIEAYEQGFIPYVSVLRQSEKDSEAGKADAHPEPVPEERAAEPASVEPAPPEPEDCSDIYRAFGVE